MNKIHTPLVEDEGEFMQYSNINVKYANRVYAKCNKILST